MATTINQQVALDEALVPSAQRLRIGRSNFRLPFDVQSKESTLQVVYDVLRNSPFFRAFLVTADVPEIYMQELWATAKLHQHSIRFKMDTKKSVLDLEAFRKMLHISPRIPSQSFAELPFEEEILEFLRHLRHSDEIRHLTNIQVAQKKVKIAFENADSISRVELIPSKIKCANKVVLNFHKEFSVFLSCKEKEMTDYFKIQAFKLKEEVVINITVTPP
nr:hypothetical protein [Tanacetum cinerariifolium]GEZ38208.1 hypothetical protein [Tanacetum cinerariifolium]